MKTGLLELGDTYAPSCAQTRMIPSGSHSLSAQLLAVQPVHTLPSPGRTCLPGSPGVIRCPAGPEQLTRKEQQQLCLWDQCPLTRSPLHLHHLTRLEVLGQAG